MQRWRLLQTACNETSLVLQGKTFVSGVLARPCRTVGVMPAYARYASSPSFLAWPGCLRTSTNSDFLGTKTHSVAPSPPATKQGISSGVEVTIERRNRRPLVRCSSIGTRFVHASASKGATALFLVANGNEELSS
eukprot:scaffold5028_cov381-Prasinococcus_capsulatus_cf.AAC.5